MTAIYAHRWTAPHGESADGEASSAGTWAKGLAGITPQQLAAGLEACIVRADPWPPTLPEFRAMCLGVPSLLAVREDLQRVDAKRAPFSRLVWRHLDAFAYRRAEGKAAARMLAEAYDAAREAVMRGCPLPEPVLELAQDEPAKPKPADPAVAAAHIAELRELYRSTPQEPTP